MDNVRGIRNKYHMWICHEGEDFDEISLSNWEFPIFLQIEQTLTGLLLKKLWFVVGNQEDVIF